VDVVAREFALAARRQLVARGGEDPNVLRARADVKHFCEWCFVDEQRGGSPIVQAPHHDLFQEIAATKQRAVVWFPIEHGKTTQVKFLLCRLLGQHPDRQYAYGSATDTQVVKQVGAVKREIEGNLRLRRVYPNLEPQRNILSAGMTLWGTKAIRVAGCPRGTKDPSLVGFGIDSKKIQGSRWHGVILDNLLDSDNTNTQAQRQKIIAKLKDEVFGRVMEGGFIIFLDTAWMHDDALHYFAKQPGWYAVKLDAEAPLREGDATLWPAQFPPERLRDKRDVELGQTAYDRQFRNRPLSESMGYFKQEFWDAAYGRVPWIDEWNEGTRAAGFDLMFDLRTGVDLATRKGEEHDLTSFATVIARGHRRQLVNLQADRLEGTEILRRMVLIYRTLHRPVNEAGGFAQFVVEDNAAQVYIVQLLRDAAILRALGLTPDEAADIKVVGRTTTRQRRDQELGVPSIAAGLETGRWDIAPHPETRQLREEMRVWSPSSEHYGDRLMSLWFAAADLFNTSQEFRVDYI
jgi:hypothetical protein